MDEKLSDVAPGECPSCGTYAPHDPEEGSGVWDGINVETGERVSGIIVSAVCPNCGAALTANIFDETNFPWDWEIDSPDLPDALPTPPRRFRFGLRTLFVVVTVVAVVIFTLRELEKFILSIGDLGPPAD